MISSRLLFFLLILAGSTTARSVMDKPPAADHAEYSRIQALPAAQRLQPLHALASRGHAQATLDVAMLIEASDPHQAGWWLARPHFDQAPEVAGKAAALLTALRNSGRLRIVPPPADPAAIRNSDTRDLPLEARLPALARALELAGQDLLRLSNEVQRLVAEHPDRPEPLLAQARLGLGPLRDAQLAESALERVATVAPLDRDLHVMRARLEAQSHPHRALARLQQISEHYPQSIETAVLRAEAMAGLQAGDLSLEVDRLESLLPLAEARPQKAQLHQRIAQLLGLLGRWALAEVNLNAAYAAIPDPQLLVQRGDARARQNKVVPALSDYHAALASPLGQNPQAAQIIRQRLTELEATSAAEQKGREEAARATGAQKHAEADAKAKASVDRAFASWDFDAGVRADEAGDRAKARELWTKAANNGHAEAAARLKALDNQAP